MKISRQVRRAQKRAEQKEDARLSKHLNLSDFKYVADDRNMTFSAGGSQIIDFVRVTGLERSLREHLQIGKRHSTYRSETLSQLLILQNILGYDRI